MISCRDTTRQRPRRILEMLWNSPNWLHVLLRTCAFSWTRHSFMVVSWSRILAHVEAPLETVRAVFEWKMGFRNIRTSCQKAYWNLLESAAKWEVSIRWVMARWEVISCCLTPGHRPSIIILAFLRNRIHRLRFVRRKVAKILLEKQRRGRVLRFQVHGRRSAHIICPTFASPTLLEPE